MDKFWRWNVEASGDNELILEGVIASESWFDDEVTPKMFRDELSQHSGNITVRVNSPGGDVFAGVAMYNMLNEHDGEVTVKIDGIAASIASLIAMAGDKIVMLPGSMMMVHNPWTFAAGNADDLEQVVESLKKTGESMVPIYVARTGQTEEKIKELLKAETWLTAEDAVELGFADEAIKAKASISDSIKNALNFASDVQNAVMQPVMSVKVKKAEVTNVTDEPKEPVEVPTEETKPPVETEADPTEAKAEVETEPVEATEPTEEVKVIQSKKKETVMTEVENIAAEQVLEPKNQAPVDATPKVTLKNYLNTKQSIQDFATVLGQNAGKTAPEVKAAWKEFVEVKMGVTNPDVLLPTPLISEIEDAFKEGGEIWNLVRKTGAKVFRSALDTVTGEDSRAKGYNRSVEATKGEETITLAARVVRAQFIYKYITLNKEDVKEDDNGALVRYVLSELPRRIVREVERAIVIGDGRTADTDYAIESFTSLKADATADNAYGTTYVRDAGEGTYEALVNALGEVKASGARYLVAKTSFVSGALLEQGVNGGFLFTPGTNLAQVFGLAGVITPDWMDEDTDNDAYIFTPSNYITVGDSSIESFTNFLLSTNKQEYLQEIYAGGALMARKSVVAITTASS